MATETVDQRLGSGPQTTQETTPEPAGSTGHPTPRPAAARAAPAGPGGADPVAVALGNLAVGLFVATAEVARLWRHPPIGRRPRGR